MRHKLLLSILIMICYNGICQEIDDIGKIVLGVYFQQNCSKETELAKPQLKNKLARLASQAGCSSFGDNLFVICPDVIVNDIEVAEGGMKNVYVISGELYISIINKQNDVVFSTISYPFKGSGTNKTTIIKNAITNISYNNIATVFEQAKQKILSYYEDKKGLLFAKADSYAQRGQYDEAITCLLIIPEELSDIHKQALSKATSIYALREEADRRKTEATIASNNNKVFTKAKSLLAMHKPIDALQELWNYRSGNVSHKFIYDSLIVKAESMITAAEKVEYDRLEREYQDKRRAEDRAYEETVKEAEHRRNIENREVDTYQQGVDAIKTVACDFLKNNPNFIKF